MLAVFEAYLHRVAQFALLAPLCISIEILLPRERVSWSSRGQGVVIGLIQMLAATAVMTMINMLPLHPLFVIPGPVTIPVALAYILITDLPFYWMHRASHTVPLLWRLHSVHHSVREMSAVTSHHGHFCEELVVGLFQLLPLALLFQLGAVTAPWIFLGPPILNFLAHANTRLHLGPLNYVLFNSRVHRIHHSIEPRHFNKNYAGVSPLWDIVFGTAYFPAADEWPATGVADREPTSILDYLTAPFAPPPVVQVERTPPSAMSR
jgi:sterol desaturase/sphingolipid hydroxylase (fatty acid hydroxylase superfamily)